MVTGPHTSAWQTSCFTPLAMYCFVVADRDVSETEKFLVSVLLRQTILTMPTIHLANLANVAALIDSKQISLLVLLNGKKNA